mgnify:CR=1 FL=1
MIPPARAGCIPVQPPDSGGEYISRVHAFFGWPPHRTSRARARETAVVHPEPQAATTPSDPQSLFATPSDDEFDAALTADDVEALTVLLENQPTTLLIPELGGPVRVSRRVHV